MATEKLKFKLELYSTMWDKPPYAEILIDHDVQFKGAITGTENKPDVIEFEYEMKSEQQYNLIINRSGKGRNQTIINEKGDILKDQLLHIKSINIDEIDIGALVFDGVYTPTYPEPWYSDEVAAGRKPKETVGNGEDGSACMFMGWEGRYELKFSTPLYEWLLENI